MNEQLSGEQIDAYQKQGFVVLENFLDSGELEQWRRVTQEAVEQRLAAAGDQSFTGGLTNQADPDAYYARVFTQCLKLADTHPEMRELMLDPRLGKTAAALAGVDGIRIWHDQALFKQPFGNPTGWHLDNPHWSFSSRQSISIWVALDDATLSNGCLYYMPGTQNTARYDTAGIGEDIAGLFKIYPEWREMDTVACPCPAGSAVFHNGLTAHGAGANMTNKPRRAMTCAYMPDGSTFNGISNILPAEYLQTLKIGDLLDNETISPMVWHKDRV